MADLNRRCKSWLERVNGLIATTGQAPVKKAQEERAHLLPLPQIAFDPTPIETRLVSRDCLISFNANRYSVPHAHVGKHVTVRYDDQKIRVYDHTQLIATHPLLTGKGRLRIDGHPYAGIMIPKHQKTTGSATQDRQRPPLLRSHPALDIPVEKRSLTTYQGPLG